MATIRIEFSTDNAAFEDDPMREIVIVLHKAARILETDPRETYERPLLDSNGNTIGRVALED